MTEPAEYACNAPSDQGVPRVYVMWGTAPQTVFGKMMCNVYKKPNCRLDRIADRILPHSRLLLLNSTSSCF